MLEYSINELPNDKDLKDGLKYSMTTITQGDNRYNVISDAEDYYRGKAIDEGLYGDGEQEVVLVVSNLETEEEHIEVINLTWFADDYDERAEHSTHWGL